MNFKILAKKADKKNFVRLFLYLSIKNQPTWLSTKVKVLSDTWSADKQMIKSTMTDHKHLNGILAKRKGQLNKVFQDLEYEGITPTRAIVLSRYNAAIGNRIINKGVEQMQLLEYIDQYVKDRESTRSEKGYLRKFKTVKAWLVAFNPEIQFRDIDMQFYNSFLEYLYDEGELENNTVSGYIKKLKSVMNAAVIDQRTRHQDIPVHFKLFKDTYVKPKPFWLDWSDIEKIEAKEVLEEHQVYKEEFLFRCYTGLRHVDLFNAKPENFIKRRGKIYLDFMGIKTRADQNLQLNNKAVAILEAWKGKPPRLYQSDCNKIIKDICRAAKLEAMVEKVRYAGNERTGNGRGLVSPCLRDLLPEG